MGVYVTALREFWERLEQPAARGRGIYRCGCSVWLTALDTRDLTAVRARMAEQDCDWINATFRSRNFAPPCPKRTAA